MSNTRDDAHHPRPDITDTALYPETDGGQDGA